MACFQVFDTIFFITFYTVGTVTSNCSAIWEADFPSDFSNMEVFVRSVNSRPVNMEELKKTIAKMVKLVSKKNQWFCIWSVLKHHNLLANLSHEAFARQMMNSDWFGKQVPDYQRFSGDTFREYKTNTQNIY